jgi:hypothetical protein
LAFSLRKNKPYAKIKKYAPQQVTRWDDIYNAMVHFKEEHGHCLVKYYATEHRELGIWVSRQRNVYGKGRMDDSPNTRLDALGFSWSVGETKNDRQGEEAVQEVKADT